MLEDPNVRRVMAARERHRDDFLLNRDSIWRDRLLWQAYTFRHLTHLLPGEAILELGAGQGLFVEALNQVTRGRNPIAVFSAEGPPETNSDNLQIDWNTPAGQTAPAGPKFDYVVTQNLLDERYAAELLHAAFEQLSDGGRAVFLESNPWNPYHAARNLIRRLCRKPVQQHLLSRPQLYELLSEIGFVRIMVRFTDFVYPPIPRSLVWVAKNVSVILENTPWLRLCAGRTLIVAEKPAVSQRRRTAALATHERLFNRLSVVVPCHNEEANIAPLVDGLVAYYSDYIRQIVLVNDNSTDGTRAAIEALGQREPRVTAVHRAPPNGVGRALRDGFAAVDPGAEYVLSMDCDFQHLLPELEDMFDALASGHDAVVGSRFSRHSVLINYPLSKIIANRSFHVLFSLLFRRRRRDLTNNLKLMRHDAVRRLRLTSESFAINAEIGLQLVLMGLSVEEVPISWVNRSFDMGTSSFRVLRVGGGYARVLMDLVRETRFGSRPLVRPLPEPECHG